jgi:hypothetical protein
VEFFLATSEVSLFGLVLEMEVAVEGDVWLMESEWFELE